MIREYETVCILDPELEEQDALQPLLERIEGSISKAGGTMLGADHWGKRKLAYEINKNNRGYYVLQNYLGEKSTVVTLEKGLRIMDGVWRFLTIQLADIDDPEARIAEAKLQAEAVAAQAAQAAAEAVAAAEAAAEAAAKAAAEAPAAEVAAEAPAAEVAAEEPAAEVAAEAPAAEVAAEEPAAEVAAEAPAAEVAAEEPAAEVAAEEPAAEVSEPEAEEAADAAADEEEKTDG
jgi:ribosomal protein S6